MHGVVYAVELGAFLIFLYALTQPLTWLMLFWLCGLLLMRRCRKIAVGMLWAGLVGLGALGFQAPPDALLRSLEATQRVPPMDSMGSYAGLIILGGGIGEP